VLSTWCTQEEIREDMTPIEHYPVFAESTKDLIYAQNKEDPVVSFPPDDIYIPRKSIYGS